MLPLDQFLGTYITILHVYDVLYFLFDACIECLVCVPSFCSLLHLLLNNYKIINISDDCTDPPVCQNEGFVKQVNGECTCHCVDGLTGPDCTQLDTSPSMYINGLTGRTVHIYTLALVIILID